MFATTRDMPKFKSAFLLHPAYRAVPPVRSSALSQRISFFEDSWMTVHLKATAATFLLIVRFNFS